MWAVIGKLLGSAALLAAGGCDMRQRENPGDSFATAREVMLNHDIRARGVTNEAVLAAMALVPRHEFVPVAQRDHSYGDYPLPIGEGQTISQPYIVAAMTELLEPRTDHVVLEVGTGSGYQAAILAKIVKRVYTIEIVEPLARDSAMRLAQMGFTNIEVRAGDGYEGWPEHAPFDGIIVTCGAEHVPQPLVKQLKPGGKMVLPVGPAGGIQDLLVIEKDVAGNVRTRNMMAVRFVPLTGPSSR